MTEEEYQAQLDERADERRVAEQAVEARELDALNVVHELVREFTAKWVRDAVAYIERQAAPDPTDQRGARQMRAVLIGYIESRLHDLHEAYLKGEAIGLRVTRSAEDELRSLLAEVIAGSPAKDATSPSDA